MLKHRYLVQIPEEIFINDWLVGPKIALQINGVKQGKTGQFPVDSADLVRKLENLCRTKYLRYGAGIWRGHSTYPCSKFLKKSLKTDEDCIKNLRRNSV